MKRFLGLFLGLFNLNLVAASLQDYIRAKDIEDAKSLAAADDFSNVATLEYLLNRFDGVTYSGLLVRTLADKQARLIGLLKPGTPPSPWLAAAEALIASIPALTAEQIKARLLNNLVSLESLLIGNGAAYIAVISSDLVSKQALFASTDARILLQSLFRNSYSSPALINLIQASVDVLPAPAPVAVPSVPVPSLVPIPTLPLVPNSTDFSDTGRGSKALDVNNTDIRYFGTSVGKPLAGSAVQRPTNKVEKCAYPYLNKYNEGLGAINMLVLDNNYMLFKSFVPSIIQSKLGGIPDENVSFYVEISGGAGFYDKGRRYNMIFHGTMADWYDAEMTAAGFVFSEHGFARDLPMGIFQFNGIELGGGDIAKNDLSFMNVNAHNNLYSPDNAGFIIEDGRHIVTFWSVAKSDEKRRAVITFHVLFDWDLPNDFKDHLLEDISVNPSTTTLGAVLDGLRYLSHYLEVGPDRAAWDSAISFLRSMYGRH